jgi:hypothetical protein
MKLEKVYGLSEITRHNMYTSTEISGAAAVGYSSGTAIASGCSQITTWLWYRLGWYICRWGSKETKLGCS